jgi:hypothetical protein
MAASHCAKADAAKVEPNERAVVRPALEIVA